MKIRSTTLLVAGMLLLLLSSGAAFAYVYPTVTMSFDNVSTYTYHVSVPANTSFTFGNLLIFTNAWSWDGTQDLFSCSGPVVNGNDQAWLTELNDGDTGSTAEWRAGGSQEVVSAWDGDFVLVAPGTSPSEGFGWTKDGATDSINQFTIDVPGPYTPVPEPSALLALGALILSVVPGLRKRIR